jgi:ABC-type branched-subunit amino acid transport system substrate-binding protein
MRRRTRLTMGAVLGVSTLLAVACGSDNKSSGSTATTAASSGSATTAAASAGTTGAATTAATQSKYPPIPAGPITFGVSTPLTGAQAAFGTTTEKAFDNVTLKAFNAAHPNGIDGHPIKIEVLDDASDVTKAVNVANQFVSEKVAAMITMSTNPAATPQQIAIFNKNKIPMFSSRGDAAFTDTSKWPYFFGIGASNPQEEQATAKWIAAHPEIKSIAVLTDNTPINTEILNGITDQLKTLAPSVKIVQTAAVSPGAVDVSTQIAQLKGANPDLLYVNLGYAFGPVWQAIKGASWSPKILTSAGAWYDGFDAMSGLSDNAVAYYVTCQKQDHPPFTKELTDLMDGYATVFGTSSTNYLTFVSNDSAPLELFAAAAEKIHSIDPDGIKATIESAPQPLYGGTLTYNYTPTNHYGITGDAGAAACHMNTFTDPKYRIPIIAN